MQVTCFSLISLKKVENSTNMQVYIFLLIVSLHNWIKLNGGTAHRYQCRTWSRLASFNLRCSFIYQKKTKNNFFHHFLPCKFGLILIIAKKKFTLIWKITGVLKTMTLQTLSVNMIFVTFVEPYKFQAELQSFFSCKHMLPTISWRLTAPRLPTSVPSPLAAGWSTWSVFLFSLSTPFGFCQKFKMTWAQEVLKHAERITWLRNKL